MYSLIYVLAMTPQDFMLSIIEEYRAARLTSAELPNIRRGRSHSISSKAEDFLSEYLVRADATLELVYVDQPISLPAHLAGTSKAIQRYPDLVLVRNNTVETLIDLKMDLGWARTKMSEFCEKHTDTLNFFAGKTGRLKDGQTKEAHNFEFSTNLRYVIVVISGQNINQKSLQQQLEIVKKFEPRVTVLILSNGKHPNSYESDPLGTLSQMNIQLEAFRALKSF